MGRERWREGEKEGGRTDEGGEKGDKIKRGIEKYRESMIVVNVKVGK